VSQDAANEQGAAPAKPKLSWSEKREKRRRRRKIFEEALGWVLVPAIIYLAYLGLQAFGGIPKEAQDIAVEIFSALTGGRT
jgi:hypothetical protein